MASSVSISTVDNGAAAILRAAASMGGRVSGRVGVYGENASEEHDSESGLSVGDIALRHEYGVGVPQRSFVRSWVDKNKTKIIANLKAAAGSVLKGSGDVYKAHAAVGEWARIAIREHIFLRIKPPLSPATVARKGHDVPLVESFKLINSIASAAEYNRKVIK